MNYDDFVLQLELDSQGRLRAHVVSSPAGEGSGLVELPPLPELLPWSGGRSESAVRGGATSRNLEPPSHPLSSPGPTEIGEILFSALFAGPIRSLLDHSLGSLKGAADRGLRIKLKIDPAEPRLAPISALPWELLRRADTDDFLGLNRLSPIVRYLDVPRPALPPTLPSRLRVLAAWAQPAGLPELSLATESQALRQMNGGRNRVEVEVLEKATVPKVRQALTEGEFHVLHFMGHGDFIAADAQAVLYFESDGGAPHPVSGAALATTLKDQKSLALVFLNACNTATSGLGGTPSPFAGVASALVRGGLSAVVAMQFPISDQAAIRFSTALYRRLAAGTSLDEAITEGRQAIHSGNPLASEWATPVLFMRVPDGHLFRPALSPAEKRRRQLAFALAGATAITTPILLVPAWRAPLLAYFATARAERLSFEIGRDFASFDNTYRGKLARIELLTSGRMRLHFELRATPSAAGDLAFDTLRTYLADEQGRRYSVLARSESLLVTPASTPGAKPELTQEYWLDFPAPIAGSKSFHVALAAEGSAASFPDLEVELPSFPETYSRPSPEDSLPEGGEAVAVDEALQSSVQGLDGNLDRVLLLPEGVMRWQLRMFNRSAGHQQVGFNLRTSYLVDERGHRYPLLAATAAGLEGDKNQILSAYFERWVRNDLWLDFALPQGTASSFRLVLGQQGLAGPRLSALALELPNIPERFRRPEPKPTPGKKPVVSPPAASPVVAPPAAAPPTTAGEVRTEPTPEPKLAAPPPRIATALLTGAAAMTSSLPGLEAAVTTFAFLDNGGLRVDVSLKNATSESLTCELDLAGSYLSDGVSPPYRVVRSSWNSTAGELPRRGAVELAAGEARTVWLEFPAPKVNARSALLVLASTDPKKLRFRPLDLTFRR